MWLRSHVRLERVGTTSPRNKRANKKRTTNFIKSIQPNIGIRIRIRIRENILFLQSTTGC